MKLNFTKMHGLGNDFVVIDNRAGRLRGLSGKSKQLCDRRFGIGADQVLILRSSKTADFRMQIFNADGSEVEMCGNGIRCLARFIWDNKLASTRKKSLDIETPAGIIRPEQKGRMIRVDMGEPVLEGSKIPVKAQGFIVNHPLMVRDTTFKITCVSMGNPHAVIVAKKIDAVQLDTFGPLIEHHPFFPKRTNVEFVQVMNKSNMKLRVWERGAGETLACGTGASAAVVAASLLNLAGREVNVHLPGGKLIIHWSAEDNHVYMTGPAAPVFEGTIDI
jgi:diaminopimelate epimerase